MKNFLTRYAVVALSLAGSAILLFSCEGSGTDDSTAGDETMMTEYSEDLSIVNSQNGRRSYHFEAPLLEGYSLAREPYREFRKGIRMTTFKDDSLSSVDVVLTANYAIYYEKRELWEAKGNVVAEKSDGKTLYTQQLFWNARTKKVYSNVDSKIVQSGGRDVFIGEGFESDEEFKDWRFRRMKGRMEVEVKPTEDADSTASEGAGTPPRSSGGSEAAAPASDRAAAISAGTVSSNASRTAGNSLSDGSVSADSRSASAARPQRTGSAVQLKSRNARSAQPSQAERPQQAPATGQAEPARLIPIKR